MKILKIFFMSAWCSITLASCDNQTEPPIGLVVTPATIDFGRIGLGSCSLNTTIFLTNNTTLPHGPDTLRAMLNETVFQFVDTSQIDKPIQVGYEVSIIIRFCPNALGTFRDTLKLFEPNSIQPIESVSLVGEGI
jgi:hypothetical protein